MEPEEPVQIYTLPPRPRGMYSRDKFRNVEITTNFYPVAIKEIERIHIFKVKITPHIMLDDRVARNRLFEKANESIRKYISNFFIHFRGSCNQWHEHLFSNTTPGKRVHSGSRQSSDKHKVGQVDKC